MQNKLENWFKKVARPLPWRKTQDPYAIWVSEIMLQQTQVQAVIPYYEKFLAELPTIKSLASAPLDQVLKLWSGLGYYSRARNLQQGALYITHDLKGKFPLTREKILKVPGIGPYTAGAILSIAFDKRVPLVDGNVMRVFSRLYGIRKPIEEKATQNKFWQLAEEWVNKASHPRMLNQALMELGATVCTKGTPRCSLCPLSTNCIALKNNWTESLPKRLPRKKPIDLYWVKLLHQKEEALLMVKNQKGDWWEGLWDFPKVVCKDLKNVENTLNQLSCKKAQNRFKLLNAQKHTVTHHRLHVYPIILRENAKIEMTNGFFQSRDNIKNLALSSLAKKILNSIETT